MKAREDPRLARVRQIFDQWARSGRAEGMERGHGASARAAFERLDFARDAWYLDLGCGNGYTVRWAAARAPDGWAVGVDLSPVMVERARELSAELPNVEFRVADIPDTGLPHGCFDAIFSMETLYYLSDLEAAVEEVARLLAAGGTFACVVDYYAENEASHSWPRDLGIEMTLLDARGWRSAVEKAGLVVVSQERLRESTATEADAWKRTEGSLFTLARRPASL